MRRGLAGLAGFLLAVNTGVLVQRHAEHAHAARLAVGRSGPVAAASTTTVAPRATDAPTTNSPVTGPPSTTATTTTTVPVTTTAPRTVPPATAPPITKAADPALGATAPVPLAGCPPPPVPSGGGGGSPWHPAVRVPDSALPPVTAPAPWVSNLKPLEGKGMWIWQWSQTAGGNAAAVVAQARAAGLKQLWIRAGDSLDGFYGAAELAALVPQAHAAGIDVIAWGFPYLYDPVGDAGWTGQILAWRDAEGQGVDGYSADIERVSEGVDLTARRAAVYLEAVRRQAGTRPIVATVYPPLNTYWQGGYPYQAMAPYVDAFAPMIYWECTDPGADAAFDVARLATLRPVTIIGQAYNMAAEGGRRASPSAAELREFMAVGRRSGAIGASFWVWQDATAEEWGALAAYPW